MMRALVTQGKVKENFQEKLNQLVPKLLVKKTGTKIFLMSFVNPSKKKKNEFLRGVFFYLHKREHVA